MNYVNAGWRNVRGHRLRCRRCNWRRPSQRGVCHVCWLRTHRECERDAVAVLFARIKAALDG